LSTEQKEQLIEIDTEHRLGNSFKSHLLISFWLSFRNEFSLLAGKAGTVALPFSEYDLSAPFFRALCQAIQGYRRTTVVLSVH
jgi:hypothetical protein